MKKQTTQGFSVLILLVVLVIGSAALAGGYSLYKNSGDTAKVEKVVDNTVIETASTDVEPEKNTTPPDAVEPSAMIDSGEREVITLAGGCFWCIEAFLQETPGVVDAVSGYTGGSVEDATYLKVSKGTTGHREAVQVIYNPKIVSTKEILDVFWSTINPTDAGGQFADRGFQYTTAIYFHSPEQRTVAENSKAALAASGLFDEPVATLILPFTTFFVAEEYHQDYYKKAAEHYERYKKGSGRAGFIEDTWAKDAAIEFLSGEGE